ncbi:hypothetical protein SGRIM128S_03828 [Streptomyces griseomycini]
MSFMSTAPRPHTHPSAISPEKGWWVQSAALAGTTSVWPWISSAGREGSSPSIRATVEARPLCDSRIRGSRPTSASFSATYSAAARSPGPEWSP